MTPEEIQFQLERFDRELSGIRSSLDDQPRFFGKRFTNSLVSPNFLQGSSGWKISEDGDVEFNDGTFRGSLAAGKIDIGGSDSTSFHVDTSGNMWLGADSFDTGLFSVSSAGVLTARSGTIGGSTLGDSTITGGLIRTASTGQRVQLNGSANTLEYYDTNSARIVTMYGAQVASKSSLTFFDSSDVLTAHMNMQDGYLTLAKANADYLVPATGGYGWLTHVNRISSLAADQLQVNADWLPISAASNNLGDATNYWNDVSYKTLTDRGCLPYCDTGVELMDGKTVSDLEAIKSIKKHKTKKTIHGLPMLDYKTFPKKAYVPVDKKKHPKGVEGVEMTMMFGVFIGAIRELTEKVEKLEKQLNK
jgi:hypothetical protein